MAKKKLTCEVLATIKGLVKPGEYVHAGTKDKPALVELADDEKTEALINSGAVRIWPGPQAADESPKPALKPAELKSLTKAAEILPGLIARYTKELAAAEDDVVRAAIEADITEAEADLAAVQALLPK